MAGDAGFFIYEKNAVEARFRARAHVGRNDSADGGDRR
jgi:hypothetical protein